MVLELFERALPRSTRALVSRALSLDDEASAARLLAFWAGLHDLGKACPGFQGLVRERKAALCAAGFDFPPDASPSHGPLTTGCVSGLLTTPPAALMPPGSDAAALAIAHLLGGHHGRFPKLADVPSANSRHYGRSPLWVEARGDLVTRLADLLEVEREIVPAGLQARDHAFFMLLAGLVSVADWIASDERYFAYVSPPADLHAYARAARAAAAKALEELGWTGCQPPEDRLGFSDLFGFDPNAMQTQAIAVADAWAEPGLAIIEAPMGEGKTEAALYLADGWNMGSAQRGCYLAMPTQATANAMFGRFRDQYLGARYPDRCIELHLLHGQAVLSQEYQQLQGIAQVWQDEQDRSEGAVLAHEWFTHRKRGLLGPFAVGTVDQALLAAMQARHGFVRLFGLANKVVIFDEVHALDTYTSRLLDRLLSWLAELGCAVVILSATLPPSRRKELISAYAGQAVEATETSYPRITAVTRGRVESVTWDTPVRRVQLDWTSDDTSRLASALRTQLANGGCAAWVCNTVQRAQDVYSSLRDELRDADVEVDLFHARFPFDERDRRERRCVQRFGKGNVRRPRRAILVATQVIEQSLDLDFDLMITDLAPVDLLLQRSGRMHRHQRARPRGLERARLVAIEPARTEDGHLDFGPSRWVYGNHLLLRTWVALAGRTVLTIPDDIEPLIAAVYEDSAPAADDPRLLEQLATAEQAFEAERRQRLFEAEQRLLPSPWLDEDFAALPGRLSLDDEDDPEVHKAFRAMTRYEDRPSVRVVCLETTAGSICVRQGERVIPVDPDAAPSPDLAEALVRRSVSLSGYRVAEHFLAADAPKGWRQSALLRHHRAAVFDERRELRGDGLLLRLDEELGIVIEYPNREGEKP